MNIGWEFPYKSECKDCLTFHEAMNRHLIAIDEWRNKYNEQEKYYQQVCSELNDIIKSYEKKDLKYDVAI